MANEPSSTAVAEAPPPTGRTDRPIPDTAPVPVSGNATPTPPAKKRRGPVFWLIMVVVVASALWWTGRFIWHAFNYEETDDAYVNGHVHQVSLRKCPEPSPKCSWTTT